MPKYRSSTLLYLAFLLFSLLSLWSGAVYRVYQLDNFGITISVLLALISFFLLIKLLPPNGEKKTNQKKNPIGWRSASPYLLITYSLLFVSAFVILWQNRSDLPLVSPWQAVPSYFFIAYISATLILLLYILKDINNRELLIDDRMNLHYHSSIYLLSAHYMLSFLVAVIIYRIGYGFDPFIHQSTVDLIVRKGQVLPKTFYYLSQYGLEVILHKVFFLPLAWLDKLLVPVLAALVLPAFAWRALNKWFIDQRAIIFSIFLFLALPYSYLILTTPQDLSYLYLLLVILAGLSCSNFFDLAAMFVFSGVAFLAQPIAGIPALILSTAVAIYHSQFGKKIKALSYALLFSLAAASLPAAFYFFEKLAAKGGHVAWDPNGSWELFQRAFSAPIIPNQESWLLNTTYLFGFNIQYLIIILIIIGLLISWKHRRDCRVFFIYLWAALSTFVAFLLSSALPFNFLISYERDSYSERILLVCAFLLLPFIVTVFYALGKSLTDQNRGVKWPLVIFFSGLITVSLYISYPRLDNYFNSHVYAVSQADIDAVRWIDQDAASADYIVLANQQVSVAALREFGFSKYYHNDIFYYPIPTSGPLYPFYLEMVYHKPAREVMLRAMDMAGVDRAYFVLNKYWWASPKLVDEAKLEAEKFENFNNGAVYVFKYAR